MKSSCIFRQFDVNKHFVRRRGVKAGGLASHWVWQSGEGDICHTWELASSSIHPNWPIYPNIFLINLKWPIPSGRVTEWLGWHLPYMRVWIQFNTFKLTDISKYTDWLNRSLLPKTVLRIWVRGFNVCWPHYLPAVWAGLKHDTKFWDCSYHSRPHSCDHTASTCQVKMSEEQAALPGGQVSNTTVSVSTILKQLKALIILFLCNRTE